MKRNDNRCTNCTVKSNAVSILNPEELCILEEACHTVRFVKGDLVIKEGSPVRYIAFVRSGLVKLYKTGQDDKDLILSLAKEGAYLGIQNISRNIRKYYYSAQVISNAEVCLIELDCFLNLLKRNGNFALEVITYIFGDEMNYFDRLISSVQQQLPGRLAGVLLYLKNQFYYQNPFELNLTKTELASLIGTSRESVSRQLKDFQLSVLLSWNKNKFTILEEERLKEIKRWG